MRKFHSILMTTLSMIALGACGASSTSAPIVYGTEITPGRVYNSRAEIYLQQERQQAAPQNPYAAPQAVTAQPIIQAPVALSQNQQAYGSSTYQEPQQRGVRIYNAPPTRNQNIETVPVSNIYTANDSFSGNLGPNTSANVSSYQEPVYVAAGQGSDYRGLPAAPTYLGQSTPVTSSRAPSPISRGQISTQQISVRPGDTVYAIARRTGAAPQDIIALNGLVQPYALNVGQIISIPSVQGLGLNTQPIAYESSSPVITQPSAVQRNVIARDVLYTVAPGDTLFAIARRNGITVPAIAVANRMGAPYNLTVGQQLLLPAVPIGGASSRNNLGNRQANVNKRLPAKPRQKSQQNIASITREASFNKPVSSLTDQFQWPIRGSVISNYGAGGVGRRNEGINISAPQGTSVRAAAAGEVVYRGSELDGYGNLLLIKHDNGFVTAYAHNDVMLVRKGQKVRKGDVIGKVGRTGAVSEPQLHFEIRQNLKSVDPLRFLASK